MKMEEKTATQPGEKNAKEQPRKPNESGSLRIEDFVRITDPNTKRAYVEKRG